MPQERKKVTWSNLFINMLMTDLLEINYLLARESFFVGGGGVWLK